MPLFTVPDARINQALGRLDRTQDGRAQRDFLAAELAAVTKQLVHGPIEKVPELRGRAAILEEYMKLLQDAQQALS